MEEIFLERAFVKAFRALWYYSCSRDCQIRRPRGGVFLKMNTGVVRLSSLLCMSSHLLADFRIFLSLRKLRSASAT